MAPEQCAPGHGTIGPAADVWGLGATLYHAISGKVPFPREKGASASDDPAVRFPQLHAEPAPLPDSAPEGLASLIDATLRKDPGERPDAAVVADALEPLVAGLPQRMKLSRRGPGL
jgi:serine/threonine protein kinase